MYFSLLDWAHPDFPMKDDPCHPLRNKDQEDPATQNPATQDFGRYLDFLHGQIREICTNYGKLDILWFDFSCPGMAGETWKAAELMDFVRKLQPDVLIDNRIEGSGPHYGSIVTEQPFPYAGDFASPEQLIPSEGILNLAGEPIPWEACITLNNHWGYHHSDDLYKEAKTVVRKLVEVVSKGGNLLLNVGPDVAFVSFGEDASFTYPLPDPIDTVLEIEPNPVS